MTIAIYGNRRQQPYVSLILSLIEELRRHGASVIIHSKLYDYLSEITGSPLQADRVIHDGENFDASLVMSIGGDGTFLNTARWVGDRQIPVIGINTGHLGYLSACSIADATASIPALLAGDFTVEARSMLRVNAPGADIRWPYALNEVAILKKDTSSMLNIETLINGNPLAIYRADGLIVSTPTGSTGYNLSVGGPILQPSTPALVIIPIAPHSLSMRPVVIDDRNTIVTRTDTRADSYLLSLDGHSTAMPVNSTVTIHRAPFVTRVVHITRDCSFVETLRTKLHWGV